MADLSGLVPTVAIVTGPSAGHGALAAPLSDFVIMVGGHGALFTAGPPLVAASTGEQIDKQTLGGPQVAIDTSGVAHNLAESDDAALCWPAGTCRISRARLAAATVGGAGRRQPRRGGAGTTGTARPDPGQPEATLRHAGDARGRRRRGHRHRDPADVRTSIITALVRIGGHAVAVVANQPTVTAGAVTVAAADKRRPSSNSGAFHLPVLFLADNPGVMAGSASEKAGILKASARMFAAQHRLRTPKFHVTVRKAFGFGSSVRGANPYDNQTMTLAFPAVTLGGIPADVGGRTAKEDDDTRRALVENEASGPWALAQTLFYDDVIDPRELRNILLAAWTGRPGRRGRTGVTPRLPALTSNPALTANRKEHDMSTNWEEEYGYSNAVRSGDLLFLPPGRARGGRQCAGRSGAAVRPRVRDAREAARRTRRPPSDLVWNSRVSTWTSPST